MVISMRFIRVPNYIWTKTYSNETAAQPTHPLPGIASWDRTHPCVLGFITDPIDFFDPRTAPTVMRVIAAVMVVIASFLL